MTASGVPFRRCSWSVSHTVIGSGMAPPTRSGSMAERRIGMSGGIAFHAASRSLTGAASMRTRNNA